MRTSIIKGKGKKFDNNIYEKAIEFKRKFPLGFSWRIKQHCEVVQKHLNKDERVLYVFLGQRNNNPFDIISTSVFVITNKRILIGSKRVVFGYFLFSITPDLFNDLKVTSGLFFGRILIDTIKEVVYITGLDKRALDDIETNVTEFVMEEKKKYPQQKVGASEE